VVRKAQKRALSQGFTEAMVIPSGTLYKDDKQLHPTIDYCNVNIVGILNTKLSELLATLHRARGQSNHVKDARHFQWPCCASTELALSTKKQTPLAN